MVSVSCFFYGYAFGNIDDCHTGWLNLFVAYSSCVNGGFSVHLNLKVCSAQNKSIGFAQNKTIGRQRDWIWKVVMSLREYKTSIKYSLI